MKLAKLNEVKNMHDTKYHISGLFNFCTERRDHNNIQNRSELRTGLTTNSSDR